MVLAIIDGVLTYQDEKSKIDISTLNGMIISSYKGEVYYCDGSNIAKYSDNSIVYENVPNDITKFCLYNDNYETSTNNDFDVFNDRIIFVIENPIMEQIFPVNIGPNSVYFDAIYAQNTKLFEKDSFKYYVHSDEFIFGWYFIFRGVIISLGGASREFYKKYKNKKIVDYEIDNFLNVRIVYTDAEFVWLRTGDTYELVKGENVEFYYPCKKIKSARNI